METKQTKWFFLIPFLNKEFPVYLSEISRELKKSHTLVRRYLLNFEKEGILNKKTRGRQTDYSINKDNPLILDTLVLAEKENLIFYSNKSTLIKETIEKVHEATDATCLLFGSFVTDPKNSNDIDLLFVGNLTKKEVRELKNLEKFLNKKFHLIKVSSLKEVNETLKKEILKKHLIINNSEKILKWLH